MSLLREHAAPRASRFIPGVLRAADANLAPARLGTVSYSALLPTLLLGLTLALLAVFNLRQGYDVFTFVNGDNLYPVQMLDFGLLDFRPPPPNRLFPDVFAHWLAQPLLPDPLSQKLAVGVGLFALTLFFVGAFRGVLALALFSAIFVSGGFEVLVSASHYSLPLTVLLYMFARGSRWELPALFALTFFNPLILLPLAFLLVEPVKLATHALRALVALAALVVNTAYSEFSMTIVQIVAAFPFWYAGIWVASRLGLKNLAAGAVCVLMPLAVFADLLAARYAIPVAASVLLTMFPARAAFIDWRAIVFPVLAVAIFAFTAERQRYDRMHAAYGCLVEELAARESPVIAAGHWTAKPLYFAAKSAGLPLTITQTDFDRNISHPWMAPYSFYGEPTQWAVRDEDTCTMIDASATYCGQASVAPVAETVPVCGAFTLYRYDTTVPAGHLDRPSGKIEAIERNLMHYIGAAMARLR